MDLSKAEKLARRLCGPINRPTSLINLGNGTTTIGFALSTFFEDDELHEQAAALIRAQAREIAEARNAGLAEAARIADDETECEEGEFYIARLIAKRIRARIQARGDGK